MGLGGAGEMRLTSPSELGLLLRARQPPKLELPSHLSWIHEHIDHRDHSLLLVLDPVNDGGGELVWRADEVADATTGPSEKVVSDFG